MLLLLSIGTMTQVELASVSIKKQHMMAKQNALYGLYVAMGELQSVAGEDTVATGSINVDATLAPDSSKKHWTGVWTNTGAYDASRNLSSYSASLQKVLVSGENVEDNLLDPVSTDWPVLVGDTSVNDVNDKVRAELVSIDSGPTFTTNSYAYWVGDEGVKATINISDDLAHTLTDERRLLTMPQTGAHMMQASTAPDSEAIGDAFPMNPETLDRIFSDDSLDLALGNDNTFRKSHFHDISVHSKGVLSDQRLGGLKQDLTWMFENDALPTGYLYQEPDPVLTRDTLPGPAWSTFQDWYQHAKVLKVNGSLTPTPLVRNIHNSSNHKNGIGPVLTQLKLYFNFSFSNPTLGENGGHLRMHLFPVVVLHNPYNASLAPATYRFVFEQHNTGDSTELTVDVETSDGPVTFGGYKFKDGLNALFNPRSKSGSNDYSGAIFFHSDILEFSPGEVKVLTLKDTGNYVGPLNPDLTTHNADDSQGNMLVAGFDDSKSAIVEFKDTLNEGVTPEFYEFMLDNSGILRFKLQLDGANSQTPLSNYDGIAYSPNVTSTSAIAEQGDNLVIFPKAGFSYKIDLDNVRYLANFNLRSSHFSRNGYVRTGTPRLFAGDYGLGDFTTDVEASTSNAYFGNSHGFSAHAKVGLFEIPSDPKNFLSLGQLRHVDLSVKFMNPSITYDNTDSFAPSYILGNSLADPSVPRTLSYFDDNTTHWYLMQANFDESYRTNEALWDGFFFSTLDASDDATAVDNPRNPRLTLQSALSEIPDNAYGSAQSLLVEGAFNVNSTSVEAWKALLAGLNKHTLVHEDGVQQNNLSYLFPRLARPIGNGFDSDSVNSADSSEVWNGARALTDDEINDLAEAIVEEVKARGPFLSLAHFINRNLTAGSGANAYQALSGALQRAIDQSQINDDIVGDEINSEPDGTTFPEPTFFYGNQFDAAPGAITQADLLTPIAPIITARSDTFRIRAYGESHVTGSTPVKAWLEAIVQRFPEKVSATEPIETATTAGSMGRRFRIVALRWIPEQK
ncbi:hypothetical protein [Cerasicoccus maritimus]|uniref:hypothetical protein n=1 Tax=Cerasicoccus maritimus TaxID=490089 RepID=UPI00285269BB|nr:hypothetical protein [Cerasicoccus maritimus]